MKDLRLRAADDPHIHLRNDARSLDAIRAVREGGVVRVMAMPNLDPPIRNGKDADNYRSYLQEQGATFAIETTIKLLPNTSAEEIRDAVAHKVAAAKLYPFGVTTHSEDGVSDIHALFPIFEEMQAHDLVLSLHGEVPGAFVMDAEAEFLASLFEIARNFPKLRIVLEHITTAAAVEAVRQLPDLVAATITDHHLLITLDDVVGATIQPHHFCKPLAKRPSDRDALLQVVREGNPSFFSGTDSAPHEIVRKECAQGCAGVFNSPYHMPFLATLFEDAGMLPRLEDFTSRFAAEFYRWPLNREELVLLAKPFVVPARYGQMVPFRANQRLSYQLGGMGFPA